MLAGQTEIHGGELAFAKGTRVALHDQRPPLQRGLTLREYILSGAADLVAIEDELRRLEEAMAAGDHGPQTLRRYSEAQARLEHAGGYAWRERVGSVARGLGFARRRPRPRPRHVLRRRADARLARAGARRRPRPAAPRRADEPPRRGEPRVARERAVVARRRRHSRRTRPLVPRSDDDRGARARRRALDVLRRAVERVAHREGGAAAGGDEGGGALRGGHRPPRAVRRALPLQEVEGEAGAGQADADRPPFAGEDSGHAGDLAADAPLAAARLRLHQSAAQRANRRRGGRRRAADR